MRASPASIAIGPSARARSSRSTTSRVSQRRGTDVSAADHSATARTCAAFDSASIVYSARRDASATSGSGQAIDLRTRRVAMRARDATWVSTGRWSARANTSPNCASSTFAAENRATGGTWDVHMSGSAWVWAERRVGCCAHGGRTGPLARMTMARASSADKWNKAHADHAYPDGSTQGSDARVDCADRSSDRARVHLPVLVP